MRRMAQIFTGVGVAVAVIGASAYALGLRPSTLPPALLDLSVYKLVFVAAGCLIAAGAAVGRASRRREGEAVRVTPMPLSEGQAVESWPETDKLRDDVRK